MTGDIERYLSGRVDAVQEAAARHDETAVRQQIAHIASECGEGSKDILLRLLNERGLSGFLTPPMTVPLTPAPPATVPRKPTHWSPSPIIAAAAIAAAIVVAVTVIVTLQTSRAPSATTITVAAPQPTSTTSGPSTPAPAPPTTATAATTIGTASPAAPIAAWTVLHPLTDFEMAGKSCSDSDRGTLDINELAPNYHQATLVYTDCGDAIYGLGISYQGKYMARAEAAQPAPQDCENQAKRSSQTKYAVEDMTAGQFALCVVSTKGNVAWILVAKNTPDVLGLKIIVWSKS